MPAIPAMALPAGSDVNADDIYAEGLFAPDQPPTSLEILNGGVDEANYGGGAGTIPPWACQWGSFAVGYWVGFDRWEFAYAKQMSNDNSLRVVHAGLASRVFLPWDARLVLYGFSAWFRQDATIWDTDGLDDDTAAATPVKREYWEGKVYFGGAEVDGLEFRLPPGRHTASSPYTLPPALTDPGVHAENRWRYVARSSAQKNIGKGHRKVRVSMWAGVIGPDQLLEKLVTPSGGLFILALR